MEDISFITKRLLFPLMTVSPILISYIITGIVTAMNNNGISVYMTEDGYRRIRPNDRPNAVEITLKNEEERLAFTDKVTALYGTTTAMNITAPNENVFVTAAMDSI